MAQKDEHDSRILGDINPRPTGWHRQPAGADEVIDEANESMGGGSQHDRTEHAGTRDVTEGVTGGTGTETGGTRNYRSGSGATGGDIGNRPE